MQYACQRIDDLAEDLDGEIFSPEDKVIDTKYLLFTGKGKAKEIQRVILRGGIC